MPKFARKGVRPNVSGAVSTVSASPDLLTYEGGEGFSRDPKSELFLLAVSNMVGESTFYEPKDQRDARFHQLVHEVTKQDPNWVRHFIPFLREKLHMRSAPVVAAAEYVAAGGEHGRQVVSAALQRADEPAEMLAYWHWMHGRAEPKPIKRGVADAVTRLFNEFSALKYDGKGRAWRMGDVVERVHPTPKDTRQSRLFRYLLDVRHEDRGAVPVTVEELPVIAGHRQWVAAGAPLPDDESGGLPAGVTWETLSTYQRMDADAWEAVIPQMGYMALLRNLRNFEQAGVAHSVLVEVAKRISDPLAVQQSKQFPYRFFNAYKALDSLTFGHELEKALEASMANVPLLSGRSLVLVDVSGSMYHGVSDRSKADLWEIAALFGVALAKRNYGRTDLYAYSNTHAPFAVTGASSVLRMVERIGHWSGAGGGTQTWETVQRTYDNHDRVLIITDEQAFSPGFGVRGPRALEYIPVIYTWNLGGYRAAHSPQGEHGRYEFGGLTDNSFVMLDVLDHFKPGVWPWET